MSPEIEKLIDFALADGVISDKEREIIRNKAEKLGEDPDEAEMILDAKLAMKGNQATTPPPTASTPPPINTPTAASGPPPIAETPPTKPQESSKAGNIQTCPACGATVNSMELNCSECRHEFRNTGSSQLMNNFTKKLGQCELMYSGKKVYLEKASIISNFPIPTNKRDFIDFITFSLAQANSIQFSIMENFLGTYLLIITYGLYNKNGPKKALKKTWLSMAERIHGKASFLDKEDHDFIEKINNLYNSTEP